MRRIFAAFATVRLGTDPVHRHVQRLVRLGLSAPSDMPGVTNRLRIEVMDSTSSSGIGFAHWLDVQKVAQMDRRVRLHLGAEYCCHIS